MPERDSRNPFGGWGTALRTIFRPEYGPLLGRQKDETMQAIGKMKAAAAHLRTVAEPHPSPILSPDAIAKAIDEATEGALDFRHE